jgi:hypothetical protein
MHKRAFHDSTLVTDNTRVFARIDELSFEN